MFKKHLFLILSLSFMNFVYIFTDQELPVDKNAPHCNTIVSDIATMTDNIAELIITCKAEKDPKKIKMIVVSLINALMNMVETIIEKRKQKKLRRSLSIHMNNISLELSNSLDQELENLFIIIAKKIKNKSEAV